MQKPSDGGFCESIELRLARSELKASSFVSDTLSR